VVGLTLTVHHVVAAGDFEADQTVGDVFEVLRREEFSQSMHVNDEHDVQVLIVRRENPPPYAECSAGRISHEP
jgi:hypothetical protein